MKFLIQLLCIAALAHVSELFLPWFSIGLAAFVMGYALKSNANFAAGFLAIALLWAFKAWMMTSSAATDLADRVAHIFSFNSSAWLFVLMATAGGLVGGFSAVTGALLKREKNG